MIAIRRGYVDSSVGQIHYRYAGEGEPLLLLHQSATSSVVYEPIIQHLASSYSTIAMDTPGFGMSDYPTEKYTVPQFAEIVLEFMDAMSIASANFFGHHTGASIACEVAAIAPSRVSRLILDGPPCVTLEEGQQHLGRVTPLVLTKDGSYVQKLWDYLLRETPPDKTLDVENLHNELVWRLKAGPRYIETYDAVFRYDMTSRLPLIEAPTLVLAAEADTVVKYLDRADRLVKRSRKHIVPDATNFMMLQEPEKLAGIIRDFLANPGV